MKFSNSSLAICYLPFAVRRNTIAFLRPLLDNSDPCVVWVDQI